MSEIIIVDNASTDGTAQYLNSLPNTTPILNAENLGFAKANNQALMLSKGEFLALINPDIEASDHCLDIIVDYLRSHPEVGLAGPRILNTDGSAQPSCYKFPKLWRHFCEALALHNLFPRLSYCAHEITGPVEALNGCFLVARKSAVDQIGLLDERFFMYGEDLDWSKRFAESGWKVAFIREAEAIHHAGKSSSLIPIRCYIEMQKANSQYYYKHRGPRADSCYMLITLLHQLVRLFFLLPLTLISRRSTTDRILKLRRALSCIRWILFEKPQPHQ